MTRASASLLELRGVSHTPGPHDAEALRPLHDLTCAFAPGALHLIRARVEDGVETLFSLLSLHEPPTAGEILFAGESTEFWTEEQRIECRAHRIGLVFAAPFLLPALTAAENIAMPLFRLSEMTAAEAVTRAEELLEFVGLADLGQSPVGEFSLEEQLRIALARALAHRPPVLLVEGLDSSLGAEPLRAQLHLLHQAVAELGVTVIAGGSPALPPECADRVLDLSDGRLVADFTPVRLPLEP